MILEIVDFDDSFILNFGPYLALPFKVVHWRDWVLREPGPATLLGPGPGHASEYAPCFPAIKTILGTGGSFVMGVCLGHQLIHQVLKYRIAPWKRPLHGQSLEIEGSFWKWLEDPPGQATPWRAQFYNSWGVEPRNGPSQLYIRAGRVLAGKGLRHLSYQFHPESVGTSCPQRLFEPLVKKFSMMKK